MKQNNLDSLKLDDALLEKVAGGVSNNGTVEGVKRCRFCGSTYTRTPENETKHGDGICNKK